MAQPVLTYLFEAHLNDGSIIQQTSADVSAVEPKQSAFYDVLQRMDDVISFGLFHVEESATYLVDLIDGHFEVNGAPFEARDPKVTLPEDAKFRLIYFRRNKVEYIIGGDGEPASHHITYFLGWQTTVDGENYQQTLAIS
jgi:hypothetical protein